MYWNFLWSILSVFLYTTTILAAGIQLTEYNWDSDKGLLYGYAGTKEYTTTVTAAVLTSEAKATMKLLQQRLTEEGYERNTWPGALSAFTVDRKKIYFASSVRGPGSVPGNAGRAIKIDKKVISALKACEAQLGGQHNNGGKCGEVMTIDAWIKEHKTTDLATQANKLMVTVTGAGVIPPCKDSHKDEKGTVWGCDDFLRQLGFIPAQVVGCETVKLSKRAPVCPFTPKTPVTKTPTTTTPGKPVVKKPVVKKPAVVKKPSVKKPVVKKPAVRKPAARRLARAVV